MSEGMILGVAIAVFTLMVIGLALTVREYRQTIHPVEERDQSER